MDDLVITRADGTPLYNLAVAVDDLDLAITEVIRGNDHLTNTAKQLLIIDALGATPPRYGHLPLLHGPDGKKSRFLPLAPAAVLDPFRIFPSTACLR